jgi:hypothetical protein
MIFKQLIILTGIYTLFLRFDAAHSKMTLPVFTVSNSISVDYKNRNDQPDSFDLILKRIVDGIQNDFAGIKGKKISNDLPAAYASMYILPSSISCKVVDAYKENPAEYNATFIEGNNKSKADQIFETINLKISKSLPHEFQQDPYPAKGTLVQGVLFFADKIPGGKQPCLYLAESVQGSVYTVVLRIYGL